MKILAVVISLILVTLVGGCDRTYIINPNQPTPIPADNGTTNNSVTKVEFRVIGNASSVRIRYSHPSDGLYQTVTTLPYFVTFNTDQSSLFLSLDVTPLNYPMGITNPFIGAQIVVNNVLFREATSNDLSLNQVSVSGTWRK